MKFVNDFIRLCSFVIVHLFIICSIGVFLESEVSLLRSLGYYDAHFDVLAHLGKNIKELELSEDISVKIQDHLRDIQDCSLAYIHLYILTHYLSQR